MSFFYDKNNLQNYQTKVINMENSLNNLLKLKQHYAKSNVTLLICDIQEKYTPKVYLKDEFLYTSQIVSEYATILEIKTILTEQVPRVFGNTHKEILDSLNSPDIKQKTTFSMFEDDTILNDFKEDHTFILIGIEAHICVFQTAIKLLSHGKNVILVKDAITSTDNNERLLALKSLEQYGAIIISATSLLMYLLQDSQNEKFKPCLSLIKKLAELKSRLL